MKQVCATHRVASLDAGRAEQHRWDVRADEAGLYAITVEVIATAGLDDPAVIDGAPTVTVTVLEPAGLGTADGALSAPEARGMSGESPRTIAAPMVRPSR